VNLWDIPARPNEGEVGLSPPSESRLLQRRKSMQSQSLHLSGYRTGDKVIKIQVYIIRYTSGLGLHTGFALNSF